MKQTNILYTTIQAGKYKGKKIILPSLFSTRSTKSILKSSYFNTIQFEIIGANFIEAFGGSGSVGLEALSRGAKKAYFIEKNKSAFDILKKNCKNIDILNSICIFDDTFVALPNAIDNIKDNIFLYVDPPFNIREGMDDIYKKCFCLISKLPKNKITHLTFEHASKIQMPLNIGEFQLLKTKTFGNSSLSFFS